MVPLRLRGGRFVCIQPDSTPRASRQEKLVFPIDTVMRDMVDDLVEDEVSAQSQAKKPASQHNRAVGVSKQTFTGADSGRQIGLSQRTSLQSQSEITAPQPTGSSPFPSGLLDSAIPGSTGTSRLFETPYNPLTASSGHSFTNQLIRQHQDIQARSSPQRSLPHPSSWSEYETPAGINLFLDARAANQIQRSPSWELSPTTALRIGDEEIRKEMPRKNLFGAVGETSRRTPTSAQPG